MTFNLFMEALLSLAVVSLVFSLGALIADYLESRETRKRNKGK